jgi:hypothetical protein
MICLHGHDRMDRVVGRRFAPETRVGDVAML